MLDYRETERLYVLVSIECYLEFTFFIVNDLPRLYLPNVWDVCGGGCMVIVGSKSNPWEHHGFLRHVNTETKFKAQEMYRKVV